MESEGIESLDREDPRKHPVKRSGTLHSQCRGCGFESHQLHLLKAQVTGLEG